MKAPKTVVRTSCAARAPLAVNPSLTGAVVFVGTVLAVGAVPALAGDSLSDSVEQYLNDTQNKIEESKLWKFQVKPSLRESAIWTDNIFLNAEDESSLRLLSVTDKATGTVTTDPATLAAIEKSNSNFQDAQSRGRVGDYIIQSELGVDLILPVNDAYSKAFKHDQITLLGVKVRNQEYLDENDLDNTSVFLHTDIFGFLTDLMDQEWGNGYWVRVRDDYTKLNDPLDASIRLLRQDGITQVQKFSDFGRSENTANFDVGYHGAQFDASVGYENYHLWLEDDSLSQAEHVRHDFHVEFGTIVPDMEEWRAYVRYAFQMYHFGSAPVYDSHGNKTGRAQILNDADVHQGTVGMETADSGGKLSMILEATYEAWLPRSNGLSGDTGQWVGIVPHFQIAYMPFEGERITKFQFDYHQSIGYSAISNFNSDQVATLSVQHEVIPKRLDADFNVSFGTTNPSDGPYRKLFETGAGLTYHMYKQLDLTLRYAFRHQTAHHEITTVSDFESGGTIYTYEVKSNSSFYQNIVELGLLLHF